MENKIGVCVQDMTFFKAILVSLLVLNAYLITHIFVGKNNLLDFLKYRKEIKILKQEKHNLIQQRYQLESISKLLLSHDTADGIDALEEVLRKATQSTLPNEKIVLLDKDI